MPPPPASPGPSVSTLSVGEVLSVSAEHLRGIHDTPRGDCWRCKRASDVDLATAGAELPNAPTADR